jgi:HSP20 family protein
MRLSLSRDPLTMMSRFQNMLDDETFGVDWDDTQMDVYEEDDKVIVKLKVPGFDEKNVEISVEGNTLTVSGTAETVEEDENKKKKYYRKEIRTQSFSRSITLPSGVEAEKASAHFKNGMLNLELPKTEAAKPKRIEIKAQK